MSRLPLCSVLLVLAACNNSVGVNLPGDDTGLADDDTGLAADDTGDTEADADTDADADSDSDTDSDIDADSDSDSDSDTGAPAAAYGGAVFLYWPADAFYPEGGITAAVFYDADQGFASPVDCLLLSGVCLSDWPAPGTWVEGDPATAFDTGTATFYDAGAEVTLGSLRADYTDVGFPAYYGDLLTPFVPGDAAGLSLAGDLPPYAGADDVVFPNLIEVTAPAMDQVLKLGAGDTVDFAWTPASTGGDVYLQVASGDLYRLYALEDTGSYSLDIDSLGLHGPFARAAFILGRWESTPVDAGGTAVEVWARSDQYFYVDYVDTTGRTEVVPGDTCAAATPIGAGSYFGTTAGLADDHDPGDASACTGWAATGADGAVSLEIPAGGSATVTYQLIGGDGSLYAVDPSGSGSPACSDVGTCISGSDVVGEAVTEVLDLTNPSADPRTVLLVLDAFDGEGTFLLDVTVS